MPSDSDAAPRHQQRERALSLLYEAELKGETPSPWLDALPVPPDPYVRTLLEHAVDHPGRGRPPHRRRLGGLAARAHGGDRPLVLRLAVAELLDPDGPPVAVVIDEAVELAKEYSTDESGALRQRDPLHDRPELAPGHLTPPPCAARLRLAACRSRPR